MAHGPFHSYSFVVPKSVTLFNTHGKLTSKHLRATTLAQYILLSNFFHGNLQVTGLLYKLFLCMQWKVHNCFRFKLPISTVHFKPMKFSIYHRVVNPSTKDCFNHYLARLSCNSQRIMMHCAPEELQLFPSFCWEVCKSPWRKGAKQDPVSSRGRFREASNQTSRY